MALQQTQNNGENYGIAKVPQPHGGALNSGGTPGNKGGTGRPSDRVVAACTQLAEDGVSMLREIVEAPDEQASKDTKIRAWKAAAEIGIGTKTNLVLANPEAADRVIRAITPQLDEWLGSERTDAIIGLIKQAFGIE